MKKGNAARLWEDPAKWDELMGRTRLVAARFYEQSAEVVARQLLGKVLCLAGCAGRIVEVEAYLGEHDRAAHASRGLTDRTRVIYGPPGHAYVYFIYGMYDCLNVVAEPAGSPGCVLVRAVEPLCGLESMRARRPAARSPHHLASGPGRLTRAFGIDRTLNGSSLRLGPLTIREDPEADPPEIAVSPRIGITQCADWPLRFYIPNNPHVSPSRTQRRAPGPGRT